MRQRLEEKNRLIEKKTQMALQAQQERNRINTELTELKEHMDIKDRKINVLQRKVSLILNYYYLLFVFLINISEKNIFILKSREKKITYNIMKYI